jgi:transposase
LVDPGHEGRLIGFGFRNFENYRIRALLYAGKPNWRVLGSIVVR